MRAYDLSGKRFGKLTVLNRVGTKHKERLWLCQCDCGNTHEVLSSNLLHGDTKSCGCLKFHNPDRVYNKLPDKEALTRRVFSVYKNSAKRRKLEFSLTLEQVSQLIYKNCFYCGTPPSNKQKHNFRDSDLEYSGIDRVDNSRGYVVDNVVPCCSNCNFVKHRIPMFIARKMMEFENDKRNSN